MEGAIVYENLYLAMLQRLSRSRALSLSLAFARQLPPGGSLSLKHFLLLSFICFLLIGKAFIEPRHYGGVFEIQVMTTSRAGGLR